ncbi:cytochrome c biogenesis protein [Lipingzhangella halophila]|uniref:Cytochrome c biogenesis protein n=1 Tax=Lipingzhangella halophila TaxID=1783352 RepID=A0A7W7RC46_9ACTN|nr:cytochrome c biogenesis protein ResB [Lipingzhangella halophila]MBB4929290.1 cytochrome c biogenesis protein [Lipingzhangella halophila]
MRDPDSTEQSAATGGADPAGGPGSAPRLSALGWARWTWRVLTSMRTALMLLFLLAVGAIPGSMLPQSTVSQEQVRDFYVDHPELAPLLDQFSLFNVYSSPWYAAIYLLLFVSLTGCVVPRALAHFRAMRARPPRTPRNLDRMPYSARFTSAAAPETVLAEARTLLTRYRKDTDDDSVAAEKGHLRETGNVLFHFALLALLLALAGGAFFGYRGNMLVVEGNGFANTVPAYDSFEPGLAVNDGALQPFSFTLDRMDTEFISEGSFGGQPESYEGDLTYRESPEAPEEKHDLAVNHPLSVDGVQVYLLGHGYAPEFRVTNAEGDVVFDQPVPFLQRDEATFTSDGVVKVPDAGAEQLGFSAVFLPSAAETPEGELVSDFPAARNPVVTLEGYKGDLGMDSGQSQSVYQLYTEDMEPMGESPELSPGDTWTLPDGAGTITFTGYRDYASLQVNSDPARLPALVAASTAVLGLLATLFVRPRRVWVRARAGDDGRTVVEVAGLNKTGGAGTAAEFHELAVRLRDQLRERTTTSTTAKE